MRQLYAFIEPLALVVCLLSAASLAGQELVWTHQLESEGSVSVTHMCKADDEHIYISGSFWDEITLVDNQYTSEGFSDIFWGKMTASGVFLWATTAGTDVLDLPTAMTSDPLGNLYLAAEFWSAIQLGDTLLTVQHGSNGSFLASFTPNGDLRWAREVSGTGLEEITDIQFTDQLYISGFFSDSLFVADTVLSNPGERGVFAAAFFEDGQLNWSLGSDARGEWDPRAMGVDDSGQFYIAGSFQGQGVFGTDSIQTNTIDTDVFLVSGNRDRFLWGRKAGGVHEDELASLTLQNDRLWLTGSFLGVLSLEPGLALSSDGFFLDGFVLEYQLDGRPISAQKIGQTGNQAIEAALISNQSVFSFWADAPFEFDGVGLPFNSTLRQYYFLLLEPDLGLKDFISLEGNGIPQFPALLSRGNSFFMAGGFTEELIFSNEMLTSSGGYDGLILRFDVSTSAAEIPGLPFLVRLFPNPAFTSFQCLHPGDPLNLQVFDSRGRYIFTGKTNRPVDCANWPSGFYSVHVFGENGYLTLPLIVQR